MACITVRRLDEGTKAKLRARAAWRGHSMAQEVREILQQALAGPSGGRQNLVESIRARFAPLGYVDLPTFPDGPVGEPHRFDK